MAGSNPLSRNACGQSSRRSTAIEDLRAVQLEDRRRGGPVQTVGTRIESGRQDDDLPHAGFRGPQEVLVEVLRASSLEVDEMVAEVGALEGVVGFLTVENVGRRSADGATEDLRVLVDDQRVGLLRLERPCGRYE
jgi:hypothetical protein